MTLIKHGLKSVVIGACGVLLAACAGSFPHHTSKASLPDLTSFVLLRTDAGSRPTEVVSVTQAADALAGYDVVFIGEAHRHPGAHLAEMTLFREIHERKAKLSLSMEQFERDVQPVLDDYLAGRIGESPFMEKARAWNNYSTSYRPLVEYAKAHKLPVIAANAPEKVVRCVGKEGVAFFDRMKPEQRGWAATRLHLEDGPYKDKFLGFVHGDAGHGGEGSKTAKGPSESALRSFAAQVTRDDTMAESIALHLQKNPGRGVVHLTGFFHSDSFLGTVERLKVRMPQLKIAVVNPHPLDKPLSGSAAQAITTVDARTGTFILLIQALPEAYATDEEASAAIKKQIEARGKTACEL